MQGTRWDNVVSGSKKLIAHLKEYHVYPEKVQIILIFFNHEARIVSDANLS